MRTGPLTTGPNVRPGEKPPVFPAVAEQHNATGAIAFGAYFYRAFDWSYATNDSYLLRQVSLPSCTACAGWISTLEHAVSKGKVLSGGRFYTSAAKLDQGRYTIAADYVVRFSVTEQPVVLATPTRTVAPALRGFAELVFLRWVSGRWTVAGVTSAK